MNALGQFPASSLWEEPSPDFAKLAAQENAEARGQPGPLDVSATPTAPNLTPWIVGGLAVAVLFMIMGAPAGKGR